MRRILAAMLLTLMWYYGGKGEKETVLQALMWLREHKPLTYGANLQRFIDVGYYKDLLQLAARVDDDVVEVVGGEEVRRLEAEEDDDEGEPEDDRKDPEVPGLDVVDGAAVEAGHSGGHLFCGRRGLVLPDDLDPGGTHTDAPAAVAAMPETFVGAPAVIAWTTSSGVVFSRS